jgi:hypothetical protein
MQSWAYLFGRSKQAELIFKGVFLLFINPEFGGDTGGGDKIFGRYDSSLANS